MARFNRQQLQAGNWPHHDGPGDGGHDARGPALVAAHQHVVRTHIGHGLGILGLAVLGRIDGHTVKVNLAFVCATVEQIHVAQKTIHKGAGGVVPHVMNSVANTMPGTSKMILMSFAMSHGPSQP